MLAELLTIGTKLYGLRTFLMQSPDPTTGYYRLVTGMGARYVQFSAEAAPGRSSITMLPYRAGKIHSTPMHGGEVISGEFTGCVMAMYNAGGTRTCAHVCTQEGYTQRGTWNQRVGDNTYTDVVQFDTVGMVRDFKGATLNTSILAVADSATNTIRHVFVEKEQDQVMKNGKLTSEYHYRVISVP